jgi:hypothetical protein
MTFCPLSHEPETDVSRPPIVGTALRSASNLKYSPAPTSSPTGKAPNPRTWVELDHLGFVAVVEAVEVQATNLSLVYSDRA